MKRIALFFILIFLTFLTLKTEAGALDFKTLSENAKKGVVTLKWKNLHAPYSETGAFTGTGFIVNKQKGLIVTNKHLADRKAISKFFITFHNGREVEAQFVYSDPLHDFAFIKVDPNDLPNTVVQLPLNSKIPAVAENVYIIGNNEGKSFSLQDGTISSVYEAKGRFSTHSYSINLNTKGGSSGSPILNGNGEVIALNYAISATSAIALKISYVERALQSIAREKLPQRRNIGFLMLMNSSDDLVRYYDFPKKILEEYQNEYPQYLSRMIFVERVFKDTPAFGIIEPGDVIWKVNDEMIGADLYKLQKIIDTSPNPFVNITVFRRGKELTLQVATYNLEKSEISQMLSFDGMTFFHPNEYLRTFIDISNKDIFVVKVDDENPLLSRSGRRSVLIKVLEIDGTPVNSLDDIKLLIPRLVKKEYYQLKYINYGVDFWQYEGITDFNRTPKIMDLEFNPYLMSPRYFVYKPFEGWQQYDIPIQTQNP